MFGRKFLASFCKLVILCLICYSTNGVLTCSNMVFFYSVGVNSQVWCAKCIKDWRIDLKKNGAKLNTLNYIKIHISVDCEGMSSTQKSLECGCLCLLGTLWVFFAYLTSQSYYETHVLKIDFCSNRSRFVQSVITQCLVQLSSARSTFRFRIQGQDDKVYILVRNYFIQLLQPRNPRSQNSLVFSFFFLNSQVWKISD